MDDDWVTYTEAAEILGCHISNVSKLVVAGHLQNRRQITGASPGAGHCAAVTSSGSRSFVGMQPVSASVTAGS